MSSSTSNNTKAAKPYNKLDITVKVDGSIISLKIDRGDEQYIRSGATELNRVLGLYRQRYGDGATSEIELLRYTALHFASIVEEARIKAEDQALNARLATLKEKLEMALYPHPAE
ncbi:cell division protein ZapA [Porphyromonas sp.]|uniref:cell division protein ZapA n=1 Tax=Porphyromonas sp. TaxID=1924944 RepID=UPI0026DACD21|nr:cell division protein ZapA [Porphyromonas sp.]MDO4771743.1 cell division protein ZapA [Porphyromonas sp.]